LDHRAVAEAQPREELANVGLAEVDQRRDLSDGPELAAAVEEFLEQRVADASPAVGRVHADQVDPACRLGDAELALAHPAEEEARETAVRLGHERHPGRPQRRDLEPALPVVLAGLSGELLVDAHERVAVGRFHGSNRHVQSGHVHLLARQAAAAAVVAIFV
jgi:hypothetical protein